MQRHNFDPRIARPAGELGAMLAGVPADALAPLACFFAELADRITDRAARDAFAARVTADSAAQAERFAALIAGLASDPEKHPPNTMKPEAADYARRMARARARAVSRSKRNALILAMAKTGKSLKEIAERVGLHPVSVSRIVSRERRRVPTPPTGP